MADIQVPSVHHDLNAVGTPANIAVRDMPKTAADALRRERSILRQFVGLWNPRGRSHSEKRFQIIPAIHGIYL
jgi:hypothetical protein